MTLTTSRLRWFPMRTSVRPSCVQCHLRCPILVLLHGRHIKRNWSFFGGKGVIFRFSDNIYGGSFISWQNAEHFCTHCCQIEDAGGTKVHKPWFLFQVEHILGFGAAVVIVLTIIIVLILYLILQCQARRRRKRGASVVCGETTSNRLAHWYNTFTPYFCREGGG